MAYRTAPAPPPKIPDGPDHIGAAQRLARRNRRIGLATTAVVGAMVLAGVMMHRAHREKQLAAFEAAKLDLEACLLGPEPISSGAGYAGCDLRIRRRQLVAMATPVERRIDDGLKGWPMRCSEASKRMMREAIELEDLARQHEADHATSKLATMKALGAPLEMVLCVDERGNARVPHLSKAAADSLPGLAAPLDIDALVAHGPPALAATTGKQLDADPKLAALLPEGHVDVGSTSKDSDPPKLADGEHMMVDLDWPGVIHLAKCEGGKCQKRIVSRETFDVNDPELRASDIERFRPTRVGGAILAVWRAGARGGLRMRLAPVEKLASTSDVVVFDDLVEEGAVRTSTSQLQAFRVHGGANAARIFLVTMRGTWIVEVDPQGAVALK